MEHNRFTVPEFDLETMCSNPSILAIGKRGTGKTFLIKSLIENFVEMNSATKLVVFSPKERFDPYYSKNFLRAVVELEYSPDAVGKILAESVLAIESEIPVKYVIIFDDCLVHNPSMWSDGQFNELIMNGRHYNCTVIMTMQFPLNISLHIRCNFDYVFLFKEESTINQKKIWEYYGSMFPSLALFSQVLDKCTDDFKTLVIHQNLIPDYQSKIFWFKAIDKSKSMANIEVDFAPSKENLALEEIDTVSDSGTDTDTDSDNESINSTSIPLFSLCPETDSDSDSDNNDNDNKSIKSTLAPLPSCPETVFQMKYSDDKYGLFFRTTKLDDVTPDLINAIGNHIITLRKLAQNQIQSQNQNQNQIHRNVIRL